MGMNFKKMIEESFNIEEVRKAAERIAKGIMQGETGNNAQSFELVSSGAGFAGSCKEVHYFFGLEYDAEDEFPEETMAGIEDALTRAINNIIFMPFVSLSFGQHESDCSWGINVNVSEEFMDFLEESRKNKV